MGECTGGPDGVDKQRRQTVASPFADKIQFDVLVDNVPIGIVELDRAGAIAYCNPAFERLIGYQPRELVERDISELFASDFELRYCRDLAKGVPGREFQSSPCGWRLRRKDGGIADLRVDWSYVWDAEGQVAGIVCSVLDVSNSSQVTEGRPGYQNFITNNPEGIWRFECEKPISIDLPEDEQIDRFFRYARLADCNDALARMYGFEKREDLIGIRPADLTPDTQQRNIELIRSFVRSGYRQEDGEYYEADRFGNMHCFLMNALASIEDGHIKQVWGAHRDITERKRSEQKILESEQELRAILSASPIGILRVRNRVVDWANESMSRISGYSAEELKGKDLRFVYVSDEEYERASSVLYREGRCKARYVRKDGSIVDAHVQASPVDNDSYIVTVTDITHQKQIENLLRFTQFAVDTALDGILWIREDGVLRYVNDGLCRSTGYTRGELLSMTIHDIDLDFPEKRWIDLWNKARNLGPLVFETHHRRKDGTVFPVEVSINFLSYDGVDYACTFARDISGRKRAEEKIARAAQEWQNTFDAITDTVMIIDREYKIVRVNRAAATFFDCPARAIVGNRCFALMDGAQRPPETCPFTEMHNTKKPVTTERCDKHRGVWLSLSLDPILDENETVAGAVCIGKDVTDRKRMEEELLHQRETFSAILRHHPFGIAQIDWKGRHLYINPAFTKITGYTLEDVPTVAEWFGKAHPDPNHREEAVASWERNAMIKEGSADAAYRIVCKNGAEKDIELRATNVKDFRIVVFHDVTERKQAERALRESEDKYRTIFENAIEGIFQITPQGRFLSVNPAMARMFGFESPAEFSSVITDVKKQLYVNAEDYSTLKHLCEDAGSVEGFETPMHRNDGNTLRVSINVRTVRDPDGTVIYYEGTAEDITNREHAEEQLRAAHQRLLDIIEFLPDGTFVIDRDKKVVAWNHACEEMTGVKKEDIIGRGDYAYAVPFYGERRPLLIDYVITERSDQGREHYSAFRRKGNVLLGEAFLPRLYNGKGAYLFGHASPLMDKYGNVVGAIESLNDVTELKRLESQLRHAQKMEAVGQLAGGIAHDFNNILTAIMGYGNLLQMKISENDPLKLYADKILTVTQKAANLTQSLLAFSRKQLLPWQLNMGSYAGDMLCFCHGKDRWTQTQTGSPAGPSGSGNPLTETGEEEQRCGGVLRN